MDMNKIEEITAEDISYSSSFLMRYSVKRRCTIPKRYIVSLLLSMGLFVVYWMRHNFGAAVIHMLVTHKFSENFFPKEKDWSIEDIAMMDSAFYWGFTAGQIPGCVLVIMWSAHRTIFASIALASMLHMTLPLALNHHVGAVIGVKILQGFIEGPLHSACVSIIVQWAPSTEKTRLIAIALFGYSFGNLLGNLISSTLVRYLGEEIGFFTSGISGLLWCLLWAVNTFETPSEDPFLSQKEYSFLEDNIDYEMKVPITLKSIPFKSIMTSLPVWAIICVSVCNIFNFYVAEWAPGVYISTGQISTEQYMSFYVHLPSVILCFSILVTGWMSDFVINVGILKTYVVRLICICGAFLLHSGILLAITLLNGEEIAFILHYVCSGFLGLAITGYAANSLDICPRHACVVVALYRTLSSVGGIVFPILMDHITSGVFSPNTEWNNLLYFVIAMNIATAVFFAIFASGERQNWDKVSNENMADSDNRRDAGCYPDTDGCDQSDLVEDNTSL